jgi:hypothetical protein
LLEKLSLDLTQLNEVPVHRLNFELHQYSQQVVSRRSRRDLLIVDYPPNFMVGPRGIVLHHEFFQSLEWRKQVWLK